MTTAHWFTLIGLLMLARGLAASAIARSPFTSTIVYLGVGLVLGPTVLDILDFDPMKSSALLEVLTEIAVLVSLFSAGVKMPVPFALRRWSAPIRLAWLSMALTVGMVAAFCYYVFGMPLGAGVLLGGILAPTDPVLATDVQVRTPGDNDQLRFTLTCEAGMNDGSAFPFVMLGLGLLGLHGLGDYGWRWVVLDVLWATSVAILMGVACGSALARLGWRLRGGPHRKEVLDDLVGLGLIAVVYGLTVMLDAFGFLAVFFAGVALRQTELMLAGAPRDREGLLDPDPAKSEAAAASDDQRPPLIVSGEALVFKEHLERLSELTLVLLLGGMLLLESWDWKAFVLAGFLFLVARPVAVFIGLAGSSTSWRNRALTGWFGVRGIGSIYYLMYAIEHGLPSALARDLTQISLAVIVLSILVHGLSVRPLMTRYWRET
ncbi:cation:proton antiporter [Oxalobacteraceae bacterium A2-2]